MNYLNTSGCYTLFRELKDSSVYVDKSGMIEKISERLRTVNKYICITRPRRFGKTINANMLGAYYTKGYNSSELFADLKVSKTKRYQRDINQYNVIHIDFSRRPDVCKNYDDYIAGILQGLRNDLVEQYPELRQKDYWMLSQMFQDTGDAFIFILDEWDSVFYETWVTERNKSEYLNFIKGLLKDQPYVELAYLTGVLPIMKYSSGSELNMFDEYNFMNDNVFDSCFGFCENEVKKLCGRYPSVSFAEIKEWYDGYYTNDGESLFNPRSVICALQRGRCLNYWTETGPMNEIAECIEHNVDEVREDIVKMTADIPVEIELDGYSASQLQLDTRDEILSAMVVYGFLSYHDGCLKIPNNELMEKFQRVLMRDSMGEVKKIVEQSKEILQATQNMDEDKVAAILETVHDREIPFLQYNDENSLSCVITLCYLYARKDYRIEREEKSGKGYCDYIFYPKKSGKPAIILELKMHRSCEEALQQIHEKHYVQKVKEYGEILLVGINYDEKKHHECKIEKIEK